MIFLKCSICLLALTVVVATPQSPAAAEMVPTVTRTDVVFDGDTALLADAVVAENGDLIVSVETRGDVKPGATALFVRSTDGGKTWSDVYLAMPPDDPATQGVSLTSMIRRDDGVILACRMIVEMPEGLGSRKTLSIDVLASEDNGRTFNELASVPIDPAGLNGPYMEMVALPNDSLIMPGFVQNRGNGYWESKDGGRTWSKFRVVWDDPPKDAKQNLWFNETAYVVTGDTSILAVARNDLDKVFYSIRSNDLGRTWTEPKALNLVGGSPALHRLENGTLLLAYRDAAAPGLALAVSDDQGEHWRFDRHLPVPESLPKLHAAHWTRPADDQHWQPLEGHFGYPAFVDLPDGDVYVVSHVHNSNMNVGPGKDSFTAVGHVISLKDAEVASEQLFSAAQIGTLLRAQQRTGSPAVAALIDTQQGEGLSITPLRIENRTSSEGELHDNEDDLFYILDGEATFHLGGELVQPREYGPGNRAGKSVSGDVRDYVVGAGDLVFIPRGTVHRITCPGGFVEVLVIKRADHE